MNGTEITTPITESNVTFAHSKIYQLRLDSTHLADCDKVTCEVDKYFHWVGKGICKASMLCRTLKENPCEDFGMVAYHPEGQMRACHANRLYQFELGADEHFRVSEQWSPRTWLVRAKRLYQFE